LTFPGPSGTGLVQAASVPLGQAQPVPICLSHWDRLCLSQLLDQVGWGWYRHHPSKVGPGPSLGSFRIKNQRGPTRILEIPYQKSSDWSKIDFFFHLLNSKLNPLPTQGSGASSERVCCEQTAGVGSAGAGLVLQVWCCRRIGVVWMLDTSKLSCVLL